MKIQPISIFCLISLFIVFACSSGSDSDIAEEQNNSNELYFPSINSNTWETISPADLNWNQSAISDLLQYLEDTNTESFLILKDGKIALEHYFDGTTSSTLNPWFSAGKTLTAFTVGLAQQDGFLSINDKTSDYLGEGWTNMTLDKENLITIWHQLTMTSGGDHTAPDLHCTDATCLDYLADAGNSWYYHNAFYTLVTPVLEDAIPQGFLSYFHTELGSKIGLNGLWIQNGYNQFYASTARDMARFGLLNLNRGNWNGEQLLNESFFDEMTTTSQNLNPSYGYLWWLNGKGSYRKPGTTLVFTEDLIPNAPDDLFAGLGANDQKLYVIPSLNMVVIRQGDAGNIRLLGPSGFDNLLWEKINAVIQ